MLYSSNKVLTHPCFAHTLTSYSLQVILYSLLAIGLHQLAMLLNGLEQHYRRILPILFNLHKSAKLYNIISMYTECFIRVAIRC